jgi:hypothetical protein
LFSGRTDAIHHGLLLLLAMGAAAALAIALRWPLLGHRVFDRIEEWGCRLSARRSGSVIATFFLVIVIRLGVWPLLGTPMPEVHDEFCHLLAADTYAHGRLTNPPHAMWVYLETFHVNQFPTYMSMFPPAQGAVLALGQLLGHAWIGVLLSVAALCGAITWMLQGWVPARWALLGGILAVAQFGATNYWMESYWGGAVAATGGALVMGAFPRIIRHRHPRDSVILALGIGILANSRPYEGLLFSIAVLSVLGFTLVRKRKLIARDTVLRLLVPFSGILVATGAFIAYYNWRVTDKPQPSSQSKTRVCSPPPLAIASLWAEVVLRPAQGGLTVANRSRICQLASRAGIVGSRIFRAIA